MDVENLQNNFIDIPSKSIQTANKRSWMTLRPCKHNKSLFGGEDRRRGEGGSSSFGAENKNPRSSKNHPHLRSSPPKMEEPRPSFFDLRLRRTKRTSPHLRSSDPKKEEPSPIFDLRSEDWVEERHRLHGFFEQHRYLHHGKPSLMEEEPILDLRSRKWKNPRIFEVRFLKIKIQPSSIFGFGERRMATGGVEGAAKYGGSRPSLQSRREPSHFYWSPIESFLALSLPQNTGLLQFFLGRLISRCSLPPSRPRVCAEWGRTIVHLWPKTNSSTYLAKRCGRLSVAQNKLEPVPKGTIRSTVFVQNKLEFAPRMQYDRLFVVQTKPNRNVSVPGGSTSLPKRVGTGHSG